MQLSAPLLCDTACQCLVSRDEIDLNTAKVGAALAADLQARVGSGMLTAGLGLVYRCIVSPGPWVKGDIL